MQRFLITTAAICALFMPSALPGADAELRESLFADADLLLEAARASRAELLAPRSHKRALEAYQDAEQRFERGQAIARIQEDLASAEGHLKEAIEAASKMAAALPNTLKARNDALTSGARDGAFEMFAATEEDLLELAEDIERGRNRDLRQFDQSLATGYRDAELAAIKKALLADTGAKLQQADALRADRYAPRSLARARALLAQASAALDEDRYDADRPRTLARAADIEARHAIYLARQINDIRENRLSTEDLVLAWEKAMGRIAAKADLAGNFHEGPDPVAAGVVAFIQSRQEEIASLRNELAESRQQIDQMEVEIRDLEQRLGGVASERSALEEELARQAEVRRRYAQIGDMFEDEEALVIRESGKITLRLVGLKFAVGEADISATNFPLLAKVESAIRVFPRARLVVEGHTDAFGSDQKNLELSQDRAGAVRQYLLASMRLNPGQISATGYGEAKPIANNETAEGRASNRRIELVLFTDETI
ncbi:MAG: OmpA family protein [Gammaproteobacteria bacterium]|nr:OmpA family protein [Gammaproteobacteria bacterium]